MSATINGEENADDRQTIAPRSLIVGLLTALFIVVGSNLGRPIRQSAH